MALQLIILAGGKGTRLRPVIGNQAKPLVKIDNRLFLPNI